MKLKTSVLPEGKFHYGIHKPHFDVTNLRERTHLEYLGTTDDGKKIDNTVNFPEGSVKETAADWIFEIPNAFPFKGTTYINRKWAEAKVEHPESIFLPKRPEISLTDYLSKLNDQCGAVSKKLSELFSELPEPLLLALASTSTDPRDLVALANYSCEFLFDSANASPSGLKYHKAVSKGSKPKIHHHQLFEILANNPFLPDEYKEVMVLRPGVQGGSEIVGEWNEEPQSHIYEYLRRNSYIPWGHYAANMANNSIRYKVTDLSLKDFKGLRHLYYQRTIIRIAKELEIEIPQSHQRLSEDQLETIRLRILENLKPHSSGIKLKFNRSLWGWNFGFDYAASGYRLHASHQQIHQQYAMIPDRINQWQSGTGDNLVSGEFKPYACGDLIETFIQQYRDETGVSFFEAYLKAIRMNKRLDGRSEKPDDLIIYDKDDVIVFVPKAQTSQWELQLMTVKPLGNILEASKGASEAIDRAMFIAVSILCELGAEMITSIEYSKRFDFIDSDQRLLYCFLPRLPESPGAFSEAQLRWINGHYPEDFAAACKAKLNSVLNRL